MRAIPILLVLACSLGAQTNYLVSPLAYGAKEGPYNNTWPFNDQTFSYQQLHDDAAGRPRIVSEIAFRRDGYLSTAINPWSVTLTMRLSTAAVTVGTAGPVFAANHGPDLTEVLTKVNVSFPGSVQPAMAPAPFLYLIPFSGSPFVFKGLNALCWEVRVHATTSVSTSNPLDAFSPYPGNRRFGTGCLATGQTRTPYNIGYIQPDTTAPGRWKAFGYGYYLTPNQACLWLAGVDDQGWAGTLLPLDLAPLGGIGCSLYVAPLAALAAATDATGRFNNSGTPLTFPQDPALGGYSLFCQSLSADPGKAAFPLALSDGCEVPIPFPSFPACRIYARGDDQAVQGSLDLDFGLVTRFTWR